MNETSRGIQTGPTQIDVYWSPIVSPQNGGSAVLSYHLQFDNGTASTNWTDVVGIAVDSLATTVIVSTDIVSGQVYGFRVRARNIFGWGPYSPVTQIQAAREPGKPIAPVTSIDSVKGGMAITWTAPDARGSAITSYKIEISNSLGTLWYEDDDCDGTKPAILNTVPLRCVIPMETLLGAPYNYAFNELVKVRVSAANFYLFGELSPESESTGARIRVIPIKMAPPTADPLSTDVTLIINWVALSGADAGNSPVQGYSLLWDAGNSTKTDEEFGELENKLVTSFTVNGVTGGLTYRFKVRARNIYGYGPASDSTVVVPRDAPGKTATPTV